MNESAGSGLVPPLLRRVSNDEVDPLPHSSTDLRVLARLADELPGSWLGGSGWAPTPPPETVGRRRRRSGRSTTRTAAGSTPSAESATLDADAADAAFGGSAAPVIDVQTHLVDPAALARAGRRRARRLPAHGRPRPLARRRSTRDASTARPGRRCVFGASETAIALLTSTPGTGRRQRAHQPRRSPPPAMSSTATRARGRVLTHTIVHPNLGRPSSTRWTTWRRALRPVGWKVLHALRPADGGVARPAAGSSTTTRSASRSSNGCDALGPRVVAAHKGLGGPIPVGSVARRVAARRRPRRGRVPRHRRSSSTTRATSATPTAQEGPYDADAAARLTASTGWSRASADAGIGPGANVYAELGSTWFLMLRRPVEAAHVLGKLLVARRARPHRVGHRLASGTDHRSRSSTRSARSRFPERMQEEFGYPALTRGGEGTHPRRQCPRAVRPVRRARHPGRGRPGPGRRPAGELDRRRRFGPVPSGRRCWPVTPTPAIRQPSASHPQAIRQPSASQRQARSPSTESRRRVRAGGAVRAR